jgi:hypothetical protein
MGLQFAVSPQSPITELPKPLAHRAEQVLAVMRQSEKEMQDPKLALDAVERLQARVVRYAEHLHWFAGGPFEQQIGDLKSMLVTVGSSVRRGSSAELSTWALLGSAEGVQLGMRLLTSREEEHRELARVALTGGRSASALTAALDHLEEGADPLRRELIQTVKASRSGLIALAAVQELLGPTDYEAITLPGAPLAVTPDHITKVVEFARHTNALVRAVAVRALAHAVRGVREQGATLPAYNLIGSLIANDTEIHVRRRAVGAIGSFQEIERGDLILEALRNGAPELHAIALSHAGGLRHERLQQFLEKRFERMLEDRVPQQIAPLHRELAGAMQGTLSIAMEGKLRNIILDPAQSIVRRTLATIAMVGTKDDQLHESFCSMIRLAADTDLSHAAAVALQRGCREEIQSQLVDLATDSRIGKFARLDAVAALPSMTGERVQKLLLETLRSEDDTVLLASVTEAFGRFSTNQVRGGLSELLRNGSAHEDGRAAAILILGKPTTIAELELVQAQLQDGAAECRFAAADVLCSAGLNGIDSKRIMGLVHATIKEAALGATALKVSEAGKSLNQFLRSCGVLGG